MGSKLTVDVVVAVNNSDKVLEEITRMVSQAIREVADELVHEAQELAPVRTGELRDSIHKEEIDELNVAVGSDKQYAGYVEYGTSKMAAQPYLTPASISAREKLKLKLGGS
jgi:HK97 gp10 family phage protein